MGTPDAPVGTVRIMVLILKPEKEENDKDIQLCFNDGNVSAFLFYGGKRNEKGAD